MSFVELHLANHVLEVFPNKILDSGCTYTGWPRKNGMAYFPQYVDEITGISVWGNFWEKLYQDHQFCFSRAHFVRQCRNPKFPIFSLNYAWINVILACHSCELYQCAFFTLEARSITMHIDKVNGLLLTTVASQNGFHSRLV